MRLHSGHPSTLRKVDFVRRGPGRHRDASPVGGLWWVVVLVRGGGVVVVGCGCVSCRGVCGWLLCVVVVGLCGVWCGASLGGGPPRA